MNCVEMFILSIPSIASVATIAACLPGVSWPARLFLLIFGSMFLILCSVWLRFTYLRIEAMRADKQRSSLRSSAGIGGTVCFLLVLWIAPGVWAWMEFYAAASAAESMVTLIMFYGGLLLTNEIMAQLRARLPR